MLTKALSQGFIEMQPIIIPGQDACSRLPVRDDEEISESEMDRLWDAMEQILNGETFGFDSRRLGIFSQRLRQSQLRSRTTEIFSPTKKADLEARFKNCLDLALQNQLPGNMCNTLIFMLDVIKNSDSDQGAEQNISQYPGVLSPDFFDKFGMSKESLVTLLSARLSLGSSSQRSATHQRLADMWKNALDEAVQSDRTDTTSCYSCSPPNHS